MQGRRKKLKDPTPSVHVKHKHGKAAEKKHERARMIDGRRMVSKTGRRHTLDLGHVRLAPARSSEEEIWVLEMQVEVALSKLVKGMRRG